MALMDCSECGKTVSDKAATCPNCGAPVAAMFPESSNANGELREVTQRRRTSPLILFGGIIVIAGLLVFLVKPRFFPSDPSPEQVGEMVKLLIQQKFDSDPAFSKFGLKVERVLALREADNRYQGIATIRYEGEAHDVPVQIVANPEGTMWKIEPGALLFIAQREWQKEFQAR
ncbi:MAG TPA: zinc ribbon domain-containing protein [Thermoanaerobaculia bacterium]|jgi:hypothetical protein|nr:zinc ribbon domain-containing protein [Thermoanaerobaculia bacterium]